MRCICGNVRLDPFLTKEEHSILRCGECGMYITEKKEGYDPVIKYNHVADEKYIKDYLRCYLDPRKRSFEKFLNVIARYKKEGLLLEVGSGPGYFLKAASLRGFSPVGIEIAKNLADYSLQKLEMKAINTRLEDIEGRFKPSSFDVIVMLDVLEHLEDPVKAVNSLRALLKDDGIIFIKLPDAGVFDQKPGNIIAETLREIYIEHLFPLYPTGHLFHYSPLTISRLLNECGLSVKEIRQYFDPNEIPASTRGAILSIMKRNMNMLASKLGFTREMYIIGGKTS